MRGRHLRKGVQKGTRSRDRATNPGSLGRPQNSGWGSSDQRPAARVSFLAALWLPGPKMTPERHFRSAGVENHPLRNAKSQLYSASAAPTRTPRSGAFGGATESAGSIGAVLNPPLERRSQSPDRRDASSCDRPSSPQVGYAPAGEAVKRISWPTWPSESRGPRGDESLGRLDLPALLVDRHTHDLVYRGRGLGGLGRAEAEVMEDL